MRVKREKERDEGDDDDEEEEREIVASEVSMKSGKTLGTS